MAGWLGLGNWLGADMAEGTAHTLGKHGAGVGGKRQEAAASSLTVNLILIDGVT